MDACLLLAAIRHAPQHPIPAACPGGPVPARPPRHGPFFHVRRRRRFGSPSPPPPSLHSLQIAKVASIRPHAPCAHNFPNLCSDHRMETLQPRLPYETSRITFLLGHRVALHLGKASTRPRHAPVHTTRFFNALNRNAAPRKQRRWVQ